jgi:hypothetical protein
MPTRIADNVVKSRKRAIALSKARKKDERVPEKKK